MIDWNLSEEKFGTTSIDGYRPKVVVRCDSCNCERDYTVRVKSKVVDSDIPWYCQKCVGLRPDVKSKLSDATSNNWREDSYKRIRSNYSKKLWKNEEYRKIHSKSVQSESNREKCSKAAIKAWENEEYRKSHAISMSSQQFKTPQTELNMISILDGMGLKYEHQYAVGPYTFDFKIETNDKPLLIEINGNYWHTRPHVVKKDKAKESYINSISKFNYKVLWESQLTDCSKVISLIKHWLKLDKINAIEVDLRDIEFRVPDNDEYKRFFGVYHYLGSAGRSGKPFGGYVNGNLICCALFAHATRKECYTRHGFNKDQCLELTRLAVSPFYFNKNLCSYFIKRSIKHISKIAPKVKLLISYSDPLEGHLGTVYKASNWINDGETTRSYYYVNKEGWKMHKKTLWNKANGMHMKEKEFAEKFGYEAIDTPSLKRFIYYLK